MSQVKNLFYILISTYIIIKILVEDYSVNLHNLKNK